jgi:multiple sugar transport system ATP-binding protein
VVVMKDGVVHQVGTPLEVYNRPANRFVAGFIGAPAMSLFEVTIGGDESVTVVETQGVALRVPSMVIAPRARSSGIAHQRRRPRAALRAGATIVLLRSRQ